MTPEQHIDASIDAILRASGSGIDYHTMPRTLEAMREAMIGSDWKLKQATELDRRC